MASTSTYPVILLRNSLKREVAALESKFPPLRKQLRALRIDAYDNLGSALIGHLARQCEECKPRKYSSCKYPTLHSIAHRLHRSKQKVVAFLSGSPLVRRIMTALGITIDSGSEGTSIRHCGLKSCKYQRCKCLHGEQESVHRKVNSAFGQLQVELEGKMTSIHGEIDALRTTLKPWRAKLADLEHEIKRDGIVLNTALKFCPALHKVSTGSTAPTGFLDLPPELRNEIYKLSGCLSLSRTHSSPRTYPTTRCSIGDDEQCQQGMEQEGIIHLPIECGHHRYRVDAVSRSLDSASGTVSAYYQPSLTRVSKKIRAETLPIFYGNIHVTSYHQRANSDWEDVELKWIKHIGEINAGMLNRVTVEYDFWAKCSIQEKKKEIYEVMKRLGVEVDREGVLEIVPPLVW